MDRRFVLIPLLTAMLALASCTTAGSPPANKTPESTPKAAASAAKTSDYLPIVDAYVRRDVKLSYKVENDPKRRNEADDVLRSPELRKSLDKLSKEPHVRYVWLVSGQLLYASGGPGREGDDVTSMVPRPKLFGGQMDGRVGGPAAYGGLSRLVSGGAAEGYARLAMARDRRPDVNVSTWPVVVWISQGRGVRRSMSPRTAILGVAYEGKRRPGDWNDTAVVRPEYLPTGSPERRHYGFRRTPPWYGRYSVTVKPLEGRPGDSFKATVRYTSKWFGSKRRRPPGTDELTVIVNDSRGAVVYTSPNDAGAFTGRPYRARRAGEKAPTSSTDSFILDKPGRYYVRAYGRRQPKTEPVVIEVF